RWRHFKKVLNASDVDRLVVTTAMLEMLLYLFSIFRNLISQTSYVRTELDSFSFLLKLCRGPRKK
ncbi:unnamed protein product, partial [Prunus brigantina]